MTEFDVAARTGCLWVARPDMGTLAVSGSERLSWLQGVLSSDIEHLSTGEGSWGLVLTKQGKILADVAVVAAADVTYLGLVTAALPRVERWLTQFLVMEDAEVADVTDGSAWAMLHGPKAATVAHELARGLDGGAAAPIDFTGLGGAALVVPRTHFETVEKRAAARAEVRVGSAADWERLRVERLVPAYGVDMDDHRSPHEASLDRRAVSWTKGCYLGQEAVCMQDMRGKVKRRLVILLMSSGAPPEPGSEVALPDGTPVGETRTSVTSDVWGAPVAIALVTADSAGTGTRLLVKGVEASVVDPR